MIAIIAAMRAEVDALLALMKNVHEQTKDGILFWEGILADKSVVLMLSGVGKGNAALSTTLLLKNYDVSQLVNIGTAGGLKSNEEVLDLVISACIVQHDFDTSALDGESGIGLHFVADASLKSLCEKVCEQQQVPYHVGMIASGDQFVSDPMLITSLLNKFPNALCAEMEAGGIAQVCTHFQIPFVVLRSLSDIAVKDDNHLEFMTYVQYASKRSAALCLELVKALR